MRTRIILAAAALVMTSGVAALAEDTAPADAKAPVKTTNTCLRYNEIDGWGSRDKTSMVVDDRFGRKYLVGLGGICSDLDFALGAGIRPLGRVAIGCVDRGDRVVTNDGGFTRGATSSCFVTKVQPYTKDMQAADRLARENKQPLATY